MEKIYGITYELQNIITRQDEFKKIVVNGRHFDS